MGRDFSTDPGLTAVGSRLEIGVFTLVEDVGDGGVKTRLFVVALVVSRAPPDIDDEEEDNATSAACGSVDDGDDNDGANA